MCLVVFGMLAKSRGADWANPLAMIGGFFLVALISNLPNDVARIFGAKLYTPPGWLPIMEFPWWICFGTIVTFLVAFLFRTGTVAVPVRHGGASQ